VHLEQSLLHAVVEPRAAKDELLEPVDERLAADERERVPVANEVLAEGAARRPDRVALHELDEVGGLVLVQLGIGDEPEAHRRRRDPLFEVDAVEGEAVAEELDDVVVAGVVVAGRFHGGSVPWRRAGTPLCGGSRGRPRDGRAYGLGARVAVREGGLSGPGDRGGWNRRRRPSAPVGEDRAQLPAGVASSTARARLLAPRPRATCPLDGARRQAPERGRLAAGRSRRASCSPRRTAAAGPD